VARQTNRRSVLSSLNDLGWPLIVGLAACSMFYVLVYQGPLNTEVMHRYFAAHPVSFCATSMFFVGLAAMLLKLADVIGQHLTLSKVVLDDSAEAGWNVEDCPRLRERLLDLPKRLHESYLGKRLDEALDFVERRGTAAGLDEELKYLADTDVARQQDSFALVRIITWATPMLGFLGTVIGITQALGDLGSQSELLASDPKTAMQSLLSGLYVAFDTTALALSLSIILMFVQFLVDRVESDLLIAVDNHVSDEMTGRFETDLANSDPHLIVVQRMATAVLKASEQLVRQQTEHWRGAIDQANGQWSQLLSSSSEQARMALSESLEESIGKLSDKLAEAQRATDEQMRARWEQWQTALSDNARLLHAQQSEMVKQGEVMTKAVAATGEVVKLEMALNNNLKALAGAENFEETVHSLSAAVHLLSARLSHATPQAVELIEKESQGRAA